MRSSFLLALVMAWGCGDKSDTSEPSAEPSGEPSGEPSSEEVDSLDVDDDGDGYTENEGDCDDADSQINPDADESCDDIDHNCDGDIHAGAVNTSTWYEDLDNDGYGSSTYTEACEAPAGFVDNMNDCDDSDSYVNPGAQEIYCDDVDDNCDGLTTYGGDVFEITIHDAIFPLYSDIDPAITTGWDNPDMPDGYMELIWPDGSTDTTTTVWDSWTPTWSGATFVGTVPAGSDLTIWGRDDDSNQSGQSAQHSYNQGWGRVLSRGLLVDWVGCGMQVRDYTSTWSSGAGITLTVSVPN